MKTWRCFHCDDVFRTQVDARNHFGSTETSEPACLIKVPGEFALLQALRNAEDQLARYRNDDSDVLRAMWSAQADHAAALRREEEKGYERGLRDAKAYPETLGLQRAAQETSPVQAVCDRAAHLADVPTPRKTETRIEEAMAVCSACGVSGSGGLASSGSTVTIRCNKPYCPGGTSANR